ncbi:MAG: DUF427 domain-containing protein [Anaerolineae bacterium]|nr:DUF427 domain-containing protein [Anaerolineae bacterium]
MTTIIVKDITRNEVVAQGELKTDVIEQEGSFYFAPDQVKTEHLIVSERTYTCPYKGMCRWVDLQTADGVIRDVGWIYLSLVQGMSICRISTVSRSGCALASAWKSRVSV